MSAPRTRVFALDGRGLAVFRIAVGLFLLADVASRIPDLEAHYTDQGAMPRALVEAEHPPPVLFRAFFASGEAAPTAALLGLLAVASGFLTAGRFTRSATFVGWLLFCSLVARNPYVVNFGDRIFRVILLWSIFLPLGSFLSLDAQRRDRSPPLSVLSGGSAAYLIQIITIYVYSGLLKSDPIWTEGQAVRVALLFDQLTRPLGRALAEWPAVCELLTYGTLFFELVIVLLVFLPFRTGFFRVLAVASAIAFHMGIALTMRIGHFPFLCMAAWLPLLPPAFWERVIGGQTVLEQSAPERRGVGPADLLAGLLIGWVTIVNLASLNPPDETWVPRPLLEAAEQLALDQQWSTFAPHPNRIDGWFVISGRLPDGLLVDLQREDEPPTWLKPEDPGAVFPNPRWMGSMVKLHVNRDRSQQKESLATYLCRRWNRDHPPERRIDHVSIDYVQELTLLDGTEDRPLRMVLLRKECPDQDPASDRHEGRVPAP